MKEDETESTVNWAYVFWEMQRVPNRTVKLHLGQNRDVVHLQPTDVEDWYLPIRGLRYSTEAEMIVADSLTEAAGMGFDHTKNTASQIYLTLRSLFRRELSPTELHGPIGIAKFGYQVAKQGLSALLLFLGFLSINLAVLNFLPIPVLDGGHMVFLIWEGITGKKPSERIMAGATYVGLAFVLSLMMFVLFLDIFVHAG